MHVVCVRQPFIIKPTVAAGQTECTHTSRMWWKIEWIFWKYKKVLLYTHFLLYCYRRKKRKPSSPCWVSEWVLFFTLTSETLHKCSKREKRWKKEEKRSISGKEFPETPVHVAAVFIYFFLHFFFRQPIAFVGAFSAGWSSLAPLLPFSLLERLDSKNRYK